MTPHQEYIITEEQLSDLETTFEIYAFADEIRKNPVPASPNTQSVITKDGVLIGFERIQRHDAAIRKDERKKVLYDCCKFDIYYLGQGDIDFQDVRTCKGKECNWCGRYNEPPGTLMDVIFS